jgi:hypothetical protein
MQDSNNLKVIRCSIFAVAGPIVAVVCFPLVIGYGTGLKNTLGAVPDYFVKCRPGWSLTSWYEHDELFIPIDDFRRFLARGCPEVEPRNSPGAAAYISNSAFLFIQRNLDRPYFIGYRAGVDNAIETILPAWNWAFKNHSRVRKALLPVLGFILGSIVVGVFVGLKYILFSRVS